MVLKWGFAGTDQRFNSASMCTCLLIIQSIRTIKVFAFMEKIRSHGSARMKLQNKNAVCGLAQNQA